MKAIAITAATIALTGCVSFSDMDRGLNALNGHPVSEAYALIGYPQSQGVVAGRKVYVWGRSFTAALPTTSNVNASGMVGSTPYQASGTITSMQDGAFDCTVRMFISDNETIDGFDYQGNLGGCEAYINALKRAKP